MVIITRTALTTVAAFDQESALAEAVIINQTKLKEYSVNLWILPTPPYPTLSYHYLTTTHNYPGVGILLVSLSLGVATYLTHGVAILLVKELLLIL